MPAAAKAAIAAGADGLIIEVNDKPEETQCDGPQALLPEQFDKLMRELKLIAEAMGKKILMPQLTPALSVAAK